MSRSVTLIGVILFVVIMFDLWEFCFKIHQRLIDSRFMYAITNKVVYKILRVLRVPEPFPDQEEVTITMVAAICTLVAYFLLFGKRHRRRRKELQKKLLEAQQRVEELEELLVKAELDETHHTKKSEVRIWMDGAFDMMHYGHMNAFRQGKALGTYLVVGVNSDESITTCKGPPVLRMKERLISVEGCKWVDEVVPDCPYIMNDEYLNFIIEKYKLDYIVHGDDPCIVDGRDVYETAQKLGKYRTIPRTEGVSTTDIVGRMLLMSKEHHQQTENDQQDSNSRLVSRRNENREHLPRSRFLTTSRMIRLFSQGVKAPPENSRVVYMDGAWDMFHAGHIQILKKARQFGDYVIVGVHNDQLVNKLRGSNMPIMNLQERCLSVLGCKYVDDVLIDAPWVITREMIASLNISAVVHGTHDDDILKREDIAEMGLPYEVPKELGIYHQVESEMDISVMDIARRIEKNQELFQKKFSRKKKAEDQYYANRYGLTEDEDTKSK